jgi:hypothetical protein
MKLKNIQPAIIISFLFILGSFAFFALASDSFSQNKAVFQDSDRDGLSDAEEKIYGTDPSNADSDRDGYSDGVEVKSGYDPMKSAPGDKLASNGAVLGDSTVANSENKENLTKDLAAKFAEYVQKNEGKDGVVSAEDLDAIIEESIGDKINNDVPTLVDESLIKIKKQDYSALSAEEKTKKENEDAMVYFKTVLYILVNNAPGEIASEGDLSAIFDEFANQYQALISGSAAYQKDYFSDLADRGEMVASQLGDVEVPETLLVLHKEGLLSLFQALELQDKVTIDPNDQVGLIVNLTKVNNALEQISLFQQDFSSAMDKYGVADGFSLILGS